MRKNLKLRFQVDISDSHLLFQISFVIFRRQLDRDNLRGNILFDDIPAQFTQATGPEGQNALHFHANIRPWRSSTPRPRHLDDGVFGIGPAGTGKTYIAVSMAVNAFKNKNVQKIILARPAVEAGESLDFLPGDLQEKVAVRRRQKRRYCPISTPHTAAGPNQWRP